MTDNRWGDLNRDGRADWKDDALGDLIVFRELQRQNRERLGLAPPSNAASADYEGCLAPVLVIAAFAALTAGVCLIALNLAS